jgi:hypothetical protein
LLADPAGAATGAGPNYCTQTASLVRRACGLDTDNAYLLTVVACINLNDPAVRQGCMADARHARRDSLQACAAVGEDRYDPDFSPANFETDFAHLSITNTYMTINVGNRWDYAGAGQTYRTEIFNRTKSIAGVTCVVQHDVVTHDFSPLEPGVLERKFFATRGLQLRPTLRFTAEAMT